MGRNFMRPGGHISEAPADAIVCIGCAACADALPLARVDRAKVDVSTIDSKSFFEAVVATYQDDPTTLASVHDFLERHSSCRIGPMLGKINGLIGRGGSA